jgi:hypothetical protein
MKMNFSNVLLVLMTGKPMRSVVDGEDVDLTLGLCATEGLLRALPEDTTDDKFANYKLAERIVKATREDGDGIVDLSAEEIVLIKKRIGMTYESPSVVGAAFDLLAG